MEQGKQEIGKDAGFKLLRCWDPVLGLLTVSAPPQPHPPWPHTFHTCPDSCSSHLRVFIYLYLMRLLSAKWDLLSKAGLGPSLISRGLRQVGIL